MIKYLQLVKELDLLFFSEDEMFDPALGRWMNSLSTQQN